MVNFDKQEGEEKNTHILGDPLEKELFDFSAAKFSLLEDIPVKSPYMKVFSVISGKKSENLGVRHVFSFKSELQRMSVIVDCIEAKETFSFVKGAPERILELSDKTTLPRDINAQVTDLAKSGFRVIAFGCKKLDSDRLDQEYSREESESNLTF